MKRRYISFIILSFILTILSWYFIACFNDVYPNTKNHWIKLSFTIILITQTSSFIFPFFEACLRFLVIKCNSEKIYKLSEYLHLN